MVIINFASEEFRNGDKPTTILIPIESKVLVAIKNNNRIISTPIIIASNY
jgi:hypothetical protein